MLKRKIERRFDRFYSDNGKYALLVSGARQVGKTFSVRHFGKACYKSLVEINFIRDPRAKAIFQDVSDERDVLRRLSAYAGGGLIRGATLVFLDEIQECPEAVTYVKFLVEEGSYHYIFSGSLLGIELKNVRSVPVGFMDEVEMFPLDFEEFLSANGYDEAALESARRKFSAREPIDGFIHDQLMRYFRLYLVVGGMPAAVQKYVNTNDLAKVAAEQKMILRAYRRDISQYDERDSLRIREVYDSLASELASENKRFKIGSVERGSHFERLESEFLWLADAGVAIPACCVDEPKSPVRLSEKRNMFKLFANDVGLLAAMYMDGIQLRILAGDRALNIGAVYENVIAQELKAHGFSPRYFHSKKQGELDFLIEDAGAAIPIEVKSGKDYKQHSALNNVLGNRDYQIERAVVFNNDNIEQDEKILYAPVYCAMFLEHRKLPDQLICKI